MNAPVPLWYTPRQWPDSVQQDTICDIVPDIISPMQLHGPYFDGDTAFFSDTIEFDPSTGLSQNLILRVQDYAAAGRLSAWLLNDPSSNASVQIPFNYQRFLSIADADSDGLTAWEEYRGFLGFDGPQHMRLDSTISEMLVRDPYGFLSGDTLEHFETACACSVVKCDFILWEHFRTPQANNEYRQFVDFESGIYVNGIRVDNPLCDPSFDPPTPDSEPDSHITKMDQGIVFINRVSGLPDGSGMGTYKCGLTMQLPYDWVPPEDTLLLPGGDACNGILMYITSLDSLIRWWMLRQDLLPSDTTAVKHLIAERNLLHELGHAQGIRHHFPDNTAGAWQCYMKYMGASDYIFPPWGDFISRGPGSEYSSDAWNCSRQRHLRPH